MSAWPWPRTRGHLEGFFGADLEQAGAFEEEHALDAAAMAKLRALGYLAGLGGEPPPPSARKDPKKMMPLLARVYRARAIESDKPEIAQLTRSIGLSLENYRRLKEERR